MAAVRTLILLGSSLTGLAVVRAAHRAGFLCVMLDTAPGPGAATRTADFRRIAREDVAALLECVPELRGRADVAIIADSDRWLRFIGKYRAPLAAQRWVVLHPSTESIDLCLGKSRFLAWCAQRQLSAPRCYDPETVAQAGTAIYPLIVRPEWTQHSVATGLPKALELRDPSQLRDWLARFAAAGVRPSISESLLRDGLRQFSVGAARDAHGSVRTFLAEKVRPDATQCAGGTFVRPASQPGVEALATSALDALDYFGIAEVEVLFDAAAGIGYLVEINARPWLQYGLPFACGVDLLGHALGHARAAAARPTESHAWLHFSPDLYSCFSRSTGLVATGSLSVAQYLRSIIGSDVHAVWDWRDPGPLLAAAGRLVGGGARRLLALGRSKSRGSAPSD